MRKWINLFEATQTKEKTGIDLDIGVAPGSAGDLAASPTRTPPTPGRTATGPTTRQVAIDPMGDDAAGHLADLHASGLEDTISDEQARMNAGLDGVTTDAPEEPILPENLPQVVTQSMVEMGSPEFDPATFNPQWHQVKHLPGYLQQAIRSLGRMVFAPFTDTPIEDIQVLSTLSNPKTDVQKMMKWITINGIRDDDAMLEFSQIMPGYSADVKVYNTDECQFMLVRDHSGIYIYGWPGGRGVHLGAPAVAPRLEGIDGSVRANLSQLAELHGPLDAAYRSFMEEAMPLFDKDGNEVDADGNPVGDADTNAAPTSSKPQGGSGQSSSTTKSIAPGSGQTTTPAAKAAPAKPNPAPILNPVQQAAKEKADAAKAAATSKPIS